MEPLCMANLTPSRHLLSLDRTHCKGSLFLEIWGRFVWTNYTGLHEIFLFLGGVQNKKWKQSSNACNITAADASVVIDYHF